MKAFARTGNALSVDFVFDEIPNKLDPFDYDAYARSPLTLIAVSSDLKRGEADYAVLRDARAQLDYLRASASMPLLSQIVEINGKKLLDGGICDSVPIAYSQSLGATKHLVVLTQDTGYVKKPNHFMRMARRVYADYPLFVERMRSRHTEYNRLYQQLARMHDEGEIFVIRPPKPITVASMEHDPEKLYRLWQTGYEEARLALPALKSYLGV
jgi:predicted patatin/cPLA2 family phospholipase